MIVRLRRWEKSDADALTVMADNRKIWNNVRDQLPHPYTKKDAKEWLGRTQQETLSTTFCIEADGKVAGNIGFTLRPDVYRKTVEIGYFIKEECWGKGIASEAVRLMVEYIKQNFDVVRVYAEVFEYNKASMKVLEKNGFYLEAIRKKAAIKNNVIIDDYVWVRLL